MKMGGEIFKNFQSGVPLLFGAKEYSFTCATSFQQAFQTAHCSLELTASV